MAKEIIHVEGMTCNHCKSAVENALLNQTGVQSASVNLDQENVVVEFENVSRETLVQAIEAQGYDVKQ